MTILNNFLSFYFQALMFNVMAHVALINSFTLKISKRKAYVLAFIFANFIPITDALSQAYVGCGVIPYSVSIYWILKLINIIAQLLMILFIALVFEDKWYKCYWWGIILQLAIGISMISGYAFHFVFSQNGVNILRNVNANSLPEYLLYLLIIFCVGCICSFIGKYIGKIKKLDHISSWYWYSIYSIYAIVVFTSDKSYGSGNQTNVLSRMSNINKIVVFLILLFAILFLSISRYEKKLLKLENNLLKQQNEIQYANYLTMQQQEKEIHKLYHDIGNHIETIKVLLDGGDNQEAREYTDELIKKYKDVRKEYYCSNKIINAVLSQKVKLCEDHKIQCTFDLRVSESITIKDIDLMSVFANLLDNAIESCLRNNDLDNYINLKATAVGNYFTVKIINSKITDNTVNDSTHKTWKKDKSLHGYGLKIIEEIVHRYEGKSEFKDNKDNYSSMVMLKLSL